MQKNKSNFPDWSGLIPILPDGGPRQRALYGELRRLIETRRLMPGEKLPPSRMLSQELGVSRGLVVGAYDQLIAEGYAETLQGSGTFVARDVPQASHAPAVARRRTVVKEVLPGTLGCGTADETTLRAFRQLFRKVLERPPETLFTYASPQGDIGLRQEVASYLRSARGMRVDPDQVMITSGTQASLYLIANAVLKRGDEVWMEDPGYKNARRALDEAGMRVVPVPVDREGLDPEKGRVLADNARAVYLTPSHQFPLGVTLTMPRRKALIEWASRVGAWIIEDDYDSEFRYTGAPLAALQGMDGEGRVIYLGTFSKVVLPGLRLGYAVVPEALFDKVLDLRKRVDRSPNALTEAVMAGFMREGHFSSHIRRARKRASNARDALVEGLSRGPFDIRSPDQGLHLIAGLKDAEEEGRMLNAAAEAGLGVQALSTMYRGNRMEHGLVIGFSGFEPQVLRAAAQRLVEAI
ncbi:PLP-dependent aminotransferase family protein [Rhizobium sp. L1K21]|uniref:MocR-like pyridoxine biosynthesis transcription factor PdxR n=1 Tax=Rhizobium sp. L1K21 TaxID=2954933 RepID=UPI0020922570|nr:PLP-dependent aminotransferase family protein [Rhizobium sp. L1K21]MCO6185743.1 PLP-dependent aminotransferase family protein [Rhizobium sp. L1K21]